VNEDEISFRQFHNRLLSSFWLAPEKVDVPERSKGKLLRSVHRDEK